MTKQRCPECGMELSIDDYSFTFGTITAYCENSKCDFKNISVLGNNYIAARRRLFKYLRRMRGEK